MKKRITILLISALIITACKKNRDTPVPVTPTKDSSVNIPVTEPKITINNLDNIAFTITKVNTPLAPHNPGAYGLYFELLNGAIYYGNPSNTAVPQFFDKYDMATNTFTSADTTKNLCACGYGSNMISDKKNNIYYIANDATVYNGQKNEWAWLEFPQAAQDNHGESGAIYLDDKIYYIGGRQPSKMVKYYDLQKRTWYNVTDFLYNTNKCDGAGFEHKLYVLGGTNGKNKFSVYNPATNMWTVKPDLQFDTDFGDGRHQVANIGKYIFVLVNNSNRIQVYDAEADKWSASPIPLSLSININYTNIFSWNGNIYIAGKNNSQDFQLYKITVS